MSAFAWNSYNASMAVELLPGNSTALETTFEAIVADRWARLPVLAIPRSRSDQTCPAEWLGYLAAERSVDEYSSFWPIDQRRAVVNDSFKFHQKKGTRAALDRVLGPLSYTPQVVEWFEVSPARAAYTFRLLVQVSPTGSWSDSQRVQSVRLVNEAKNAHTLLQQIDIETEDQVQVRVGMSFASFVRTRMEVPPVVVPPPEPLLGTTTIRFGMGILSRITHRMGTA